ncbi:hypothetical protein DL96DRAFT_1462313 [Flagelloscypha sp. PMI_526]|nr:hypothetical protein DL96DRAFT_1462313 [Flagelloscypha sp. PMI_526]
MVPLFDDAFTQFSNSNPARLGVEAQLQSPFSFEDSFKDAFIPQFSDPIPARLDVNIQPHVLPSLHNVSFDDAFTAFSDPSPAGLSPGIFSATAEEIDLVDAVFKEGDPNNSGRLHGENAVVIFARSNIPPSTMGDIWTFADEKNNGYLTRDETAMALRLMSCSREGLVPSKALSMRPSSPESLRQLKALIFNEFLRLPPFTMEERTKFLKVFEAYSPSNGLLAEHVVRGAFARSGLSANEQSQVWTLAHIKGRNALDATEFCLAMHLIYHRLNNNITRLSDTLPPQLYEQIQKTMALPQPADSPVSPKIIDSPTSHLTLLLARSAFVKTTYESQDDPKSQWPISPEEKARFDNYFTTLDSQNRGRLDGDAAVPFFTKSQLSEKQLAQVWDLADIDLKGYLTKDEFAVAMHLIKKRKKGERLPSILPAALVPPSQRRISVSKTVDFDVYFDKLDSSRCGYIEGDVAKDFMKESKLPDTDLAAIWFVLCLSVFLSHANLYTLHFRDLADTRGAGRLSRAEFAHAMWLIYDRLDGKSIPSFF